MLLQALYGYAQTRQLLANLPLEHRTLHALIDLDADGKLRSPCLKELTHTNSKGKESPGFEYLLPRFEGEKNGGKASFLAEGSVAVFGREKKFGNPIYAQVTTGSNQSDRFATKAFLHFWEQVQTAFDSTNDPRLKAMLIFKRDYLLVQDGLIQCQLPFVRMRVKDKGKKQGDLEFVANTGATDLNYIVIEKSTFGFSVDGNPVVLTNEDDPLREYWLSQYVRESLVEEGEDRTPPDKVVSSNSATICLVTGRTGEAIARSHKPKIMGVPGAGSGGYIVSFAKAAPAFSSYGFEMGENAPISESAAAMYALALTELLGDEDSTIKLGPVAVCSWSKNSPTASKQMTRLLTKAFPSEVGQFLKMPFAGVPEHEVRNSDRLYTIALSGNKARIVIQHWIDQALPEAAQHFQRWWDDLQVAPMFSEAISATKAKKTTTNEPAQKWPSSYAIPSLARVTLRQSKDQEEKKLVSERIVQLYRAALEGTAPSLMLLKPILDEFQSALLKNNPRIDPFNPSRFALIKLILIRNNALPELPEGKKGEFMQLVADTTDDAYNCGRLLAVMEALQNRSRKAGKTQQERKTTDRPNAGVIARYYGRASTAPATVFALLLGLSHHHESKLQRGNEADKRAAGGFERRKIEILSRLRPDTNVSNSAPNFPKLLKLVEQGRFALGYYHQKAHDREEFRKYLESKGKEGDDLADADDDGEET